MNRPLSLIADPFPYHTLKKCPYFWDQTSDFQKLSLFNKLEAAIADVLTIDFKLKKSKAVSNMLLWALMLSMEYTINGQMFPASVVIVYIWTVLNKYNYDATSDLHDDMVRWSCKYTSNLYLNKTPKPFYWKLVLF